MTSDAMTTQAITASGAYPTNGSSQRDEVGAGHYDENADDIAVVSLAGLEVEIELPEELVAPHKAQRGGTWRGGIIVLADDPALNG